MFEIFFIFSNVLLNDWLVDMHIFQFRVETIKITSLSSCLFQHGRSIDSNYLRSRLDVLIIPRLHGADSCL